VRAGRAALREWRARANKITTSRRRVKRNLVSSFWRVYFCELIYMYVSIYACMSHLQDPTFMMKIVQECSRTYKIAGLKAYEFSPLGTIFCLSLHFWEWQLSVYTRPPLLSIATVYVDYMNWRGNNFRICADKCAKKQSNSARGSFAAAVCTLLRWSWAARRRWVCDRVSF